MKKYPIVLLLNAIMLAAFCQISPRSIESIGLNDISIIELAGNGDIWAGSSSQGLAFYKASEGSWQYFNTGNTPQLASDNVTAIWVNAITGVQHAVIGTMGGATDFVDAVPGALTMLPEPTVRGVLYRPDSLWILTDNKINRYDSTITFRTTFTPALSAITCTQKPNSACGGFWAGTANNGCFYTSNGQNYTYIDTTPTNQKLVDNRVNAIAIDNQCIAKFIGTKGGFSMCPVGAPCQNFTTANGLPQNDITAIASVCGRVWLGTRDSGIVVFNPSNSSFARMTTANGLPDNRITSISGNQATCITYIGTLNGSIALADTGRNLISVLSGISNMSRQNFGVNVFPQPAGNDLNFIFENDIANGQLNLTDITGKMVNQAQVRNQNHVTVNVDYLQQGIYFYQLYSNNQLMKTGRVEVTR